MKKIKVVLGLIILTAAIFYFGNKPSVAKVVKKSPMPMSVKTLNFVPYDGEKIKFSYEDKYVLSENDETIQLLGKSGNPSTIVITIRNTDAGSVDEVSGVAMRRVKSGDFEEVKLTDGLMFVKHNPYELTAFYLHDKKSLTVAMVVNSNDEKSSRIEFDKLLNTLELK